MSRRRRREVSLAAIGVSAALAGAPQPALAHAIGGTYQLPVPLWLYLAGAAAAAAASFAVISWRGGRGPDAWQGRLVGVPPRLATLSAAALRVLGLAWWYGAIAVGFLVGETSPLPAVLFWVGIWVALPIVAAVIGNPWPLLSPFRTTFSGIEWLARRLGADLDAAGGAYPASLARWPAVVLLAAAVWAELILPGGELASTVAALMLAYTFLTLAGMTLFGRAGWLRNAELFEVILGWFGRIGAVARAAADDAPSSERAVELRPWFAGLTRLMRLGWSDAAFIVLLLAGITYDGLRETAAGAALLDWLLPPISAAFGTTLTAFLLVDTAGFVALAAAFMAAFAAALAITAALSPAARAEGATAGAYAVTLLPIAAGYLVAHYWTLVVQGAVWLPSLLVEPLQGVSPSVDWIPVSLVWYLSVVAIVGGHVVAVLLAHRLGVRQGRRASARAGAPIVLLMIGYTVLSLWIIAQPMIVEPGRPGAGVGG